MKDEMYGSSIPAYRSYKLKPLTAMVAWCISNWGSFDKQGNQVRPFRY
jgi:hypothetical protein